MACLVLAIIAGQALTFVVQEGRSAVVIRLGRPKRVVDEPGLHWRAPWPIDAVEVVDLRRRVLTTPETELLTRDRKNVVLVTSAVWFPSDPLLFHRTLGSVVEAEEKLTALLVNAKISTFGSHELSALVSTDAALLQVGSIEEQILNHTNQVSEKEYGVTLVGVGFCRVSLPENNLEFVFEQMRSERRKFAATFRADGELEAARIRGQADLEAAKLLAQGHEEAARIRGQAEAEAARIYAAAHAQDPELHSFLGSLESLERILGAESSVLLRTDAEPFSLLKGPIQTLAPKSRARGGPSPVGIGDG